MEKQKIKKRNWEEIVLEQDTAVTYELLLACEEGDLQEVKKGIKLYHQACIRVAKYELWQHLRYLMQDVILAKYSDNYHTQKHWERICKWRNKIDDDFEFDNFLTEKTIKNEWEDAFLTARKLAINFTPNASELLKLTWTEVFEQSYHPSDYGK